MTFGKVPSKRKVHLLDGSSSLGHVKHVHYSTALNGLDASCRTILSATRILSGQHYNQCDKATNKDQARERREREREREEREKRGKAQWF